jgi:protein-S-isoprenylcysteine O-methyltransferase Ste14
MVTNSDKPTNVYDNTAISVAGLLFLFQLIDLFYYDNFSLNIILLGIGWILLIPSFLIICLSITALRAYGNAPKTRSLVDTTLIVTKGIYRIIRHPLYVGWILMATSLASVSQSCVSALCAAIIIPLAIVSIIREDESNIAKFGDAYVQYQQEVPLMNIFKGLRRYYSSERTS